MGYPTIFLIVLSRCYFCFRVAVTNPPALITSVRKKPPCWPIENTGIAIIHNFIPGFIQLFGFVMFVSKFKIKIIFIAKTSFYGIASTIFVTRMPNQKLNLLRRQPSVAPGDLLH